MLTPLYDPSNVETPVSPYSVRKMDFSTVKLLDSNLELSDGAYFENNNHSLNNVASLPKVTSNEQQRATKNVAILHSQEVSLCGASDQVHTQNNTDVTLSVDSAQLRPPNKPKPANIVATENLNIAFSKLAPI